MSTKLSARCSQWSAHIVHQSPLETITAMQPRITKIICGSPLISEMSFCTSSLEIIVSLTIEATPVYGSCILSYQINKLSVGKDFKKVYRDFIYYFEQLHSRSFCDGNFAASLAFNSAFLLADMLAYFSLALCRLTSLCSMQSTEIPNVMVYELWAKLKMKQL